VPDRRQHLRLAPQHALEVQDRDHVARISMSFGADRP